ncbi:MAG: undecaprenyl-diphosphate phosphatase [Chloroflexota bacterium]
MEEILKILILGIVEGITEFLPISSTGHLLVTSALLNSEVASRLGGTFEIFIQIGAVLAVVFYYRRDLWQQARTVHRDRKAQRFWLAILIAAIPAGVAGLLLRDFIKDNLFTPENSPLVVALALIVGGVIFLIVEQHLAQRVEDPHPVDPPEDVMVISLRQSLWVGIAQTTALIPGVSRSGASIVGAMLAGVPRSAATAFSFYLAIPVLGGATILDLLLSLDQLEGGDLIYLMLGAFVSGIIAWIAIDWLLRYVARNNFVIFGYYRIIAGVVILLLIAGDVV